MILIYALFMSHISFAQMNGSVLLVPEEDSVAKNSCWATLYNEEFFRGSGLTVFNGHDVENLEFSAGPVWREKIRSIVTGPTGTLYLYSQEDHEGKRYVVGPGEHLKKIPWSDFKSFKLTCVP